MNERTIQNALYQRLNFDLKHVLWVPNIRMSLGEFDLFSVTRSLYAFDFEIKISRSDFRADFKHKTRKHEVYAALAEKREHDARKTFHPLAKPMFPNYFVYVVPENLISADEIPAYAGLWYWRHQPEGHHRKFGLVSEKIRPPRLHCTKVSDDLMKQVARTFQYRYWNLRLGASDVLPEMSD